jgi:4a-hydroxytetrahydrobiopterin dehydratase
MNQLTDKKCVPCEGGVEPLSRGQAEELLEQLSGWTLADDARSLHREWKFRNFYHTMSFVNAVAHIANAEDHHPDMEIGWGYCRIRYSTHAINGLSENDFICAAKVDTLPRQ